jgi:nicotinic acid mononucleotide adenylyltransferase
MQPIIIFLACVIGLFLLAALFLYLRKLRLNQNQHCRFSEDEYQQGKVHKDAKQHIRAPSLETRLSIKPAIQPTINTAIKPAIKPTINTAIKPTIDTAINTAINATIKPAINTAINTAIKPAINTAINTAIKPAINTVIKPAISPDTRVVCSLYISGAFNPIHNGHLEMVQLALNQMKELNFRVSTVFFGLGNQKHYLERKVSKANAENKKNNYKNYPRTLFSQEERLQMVQSAINNRKWEPADVRVLVDRTELDGREDHYEAVIKLQNNQKHKVFLIAGEDLRNGMSIIWNNNGINRIVVRRPDQTTFKPDTVAKETGLMEVYVNGNEATDEVSSTRISNGDLTSLPDSIRDI